MKICSSCCFIAWLFHCRNNSLIQNKLNHQQYCSCDARFEVSIFEGEDSGWKSFHPPWHSICVCFSSLGRFRSARDYYPLMRLNHSTHLSQVLPKLLYPSISWCNFLRRAIVGALGKRFIVILKQHSKGTEQMKDEPIDGKSHFLRHLMEWSVTFWFLRTLTCRRRRNFWKCIAGARTHVQRLCCRALDVERLSLGTSRHSIRINNDPSSIRTTTSTGGGCLVSFGCWWQWLISGGTRRTLDVCGVEGWFHRW